MLSFPRIHGVLLLSCKDFAVEIPSHCCLRLTGSTLPQSHVTTAEHHLEKGGIPAWCPKELCVIY